MYAFIILFSDLLALLNRQQHAGVDALEDLKIIVMAEASAVRITTVLNLQNPMGTK